MEDSNENSKDFLYFVLDVDSVMNTILKLHLSIYFIIVGCSQKDNSDVNNGVNVVNPIYIGPCNSERITISEIAKNALMESGMTQCTMPFGVLISADQDMPELYLEMAGKILAEMLDQNIDGVIDDSALIEHVTNWESGWLAMPTNFNQWEAEQLPNLSDYLGYDIIIPSWWMGIHESNPDNQAIAVMVEEITHFLTQFGYSLQYPDKFGVEDWTSVIAQETLNAQCIWWQHPENSCPNSPAVIGGDCSHPNCDVVEFYHQVLILRSGMIPGWFGINFPESANDLELLLSDEIKQLLDDETYHQLKSPLTFNYPVLEQ